MKTETITASRLEGPLNARVKVDCGSIQAERPETIQELIDNYDDSEILKCFWAAFVIQEQAKLRNPTKERIPVTPETRKFSELLKNASPEKRAEVLAVLEQLGHSVDG